MWKRDPLTTNVIAARWNRTTSGWWLWVKGRKEVHGEGATFEVAQEAFTRAIWNAAPDLDSVIPTILEFDPPLPASASIEPYLHPELFLVSGEEFCELYGPTRSPGGLSEQRRAYLESLFTGGICPACRRGRGERTVVPMCIDDAPPRVDAGRIRAPFRNNIHIFSERFLDLLSADEKSRLSFQAVDLPARARRQFFELRGRPDVGVVGIRGLESDGLECPECRHRSLRVLHPKLKEEGMNLETFVCAEELPSPLRSCFTVGLCNDITLCMTRARWDSLREHPHARGVMSERIGVAQDGDCERNPRICNRLKHCALCATWPEPLAVDNQPRAVFDRPALTCSPSNFTWLAEAERRGYIATSQATLPALELWELAQREARDARTEFVSLRCPSCWHLGWIILTPSELKLLWRHGWW